MAAGETVYFKCTQYTKDKSGACLDRNSSLGALGGAGTGWKDPKTVWLYISPTQLYLKAKYLLIFYPKTWAVRLAPSTQLDLTPSKALDPPGIPSEALLRITTRFQKESIVLHVPHPHRNVVYALFEHYLRGKRFPEKASATFAAKTAFFHSKIKAAAPRLSGKYLGVGTQISSLCSVFF